VIWSWRRSAKNSTNVEKAFLTMAAEIKSRIAAQPAIGATKKAVQVSGQEVSSGGGCCS
jgi:Ras-related protein Rab-1A